MNIVPIVGDSRPPPGMRFAGTEQELFKILLRGSLLQIPTFGFYRFWLITDVRRHLWSRTQIGEDAFEYTGRGKELLIGFLIALAVLVPVYLLYFLAALEAERLQAFAGIPLFLVVYLLGHYAVFRARRYRATRTIFRGVRFWMTGSGFAYLGLAILWDVLTVISLGFAYPWRSAALERYKMRHTRYGNLEGAFVSSGWSLFKRGGWIWAAFLVMLTLAGVAGVRQHWVSLIALGILIAVTAPFLLPVFRGMELRWWLDGVRLGPIEVASDVPIGTVVWCYLKTVLISMGFGLGSSIAFGLIAGILGGLFAAIHGREAEIAEGLKVSGAIVGGLIITVLYIAFLLGLDIIRRLFLDRGLWAVAANSVTFKNLEALEGVRGTGAEQAGSLGEGLLDALDMGGF